jgi:hypothetical protein
MSSRPNCFATALTSASTASASAWSALKAAAHAFGLELLHHLLRLVGGGGIADGDIGPVIGERLGDRGADAARAASDERYFSRQCLRHVRLLLVCVR